MTFILDFKKIFITNSLSFIIQYFKTLKVFFHVSISLLGFIIFIFTINQLISGIALSFSLMNDSLLTMLSREEEDIENLYTDDFFWLHERGVDFIVIFVYLHFFRKIFLGINDLEQEHAWKSGIMSFLILQVTIFAGLVLCTTHLSEITLIIAINAFQTFFAFIGKGYWWFFPGKSLNTDTMIRLAYFHYVIAFFFFFLGLFHGIDMHYDWKPHTHWSGIKQQLNWWDEVLINEIGLFFNILILCFFFNLYLYSQPEALSYELFMWGDTGFITDIRFYSVAPHWYFRPFMAWLIACPYHYVGIFGLVYFFLITYFQISLFSYNSIYNLYTHHSISLFFVDILKIIFSFKILTWFISKKKIVELQNNLFNKSINSWNHINYDYSKQWVIAYAIFIICIAYTLSFLPYGRFFNKIGGNSALLLSYFYIFSFFNFTFLRNSALLNNFKINLINY